MGKPIFTPIQISESQSQLFEGLFKSEILEELKSLKDQISRLELRLEDPFG